MYSSVSECTQITYKSVFQELVRSHTTYAVTENKLLELTTADVTFLRTIQNNF